MKSEHKNKNYVSGSELARAYVVIQPYSDIYSPEEALQRGTVFPDLYQPYMSKDKKGRY